MAAGPAIYVRHTIKGFGGWGDSVFTSSQGEITLPAVGSSDEYPCYVCVWHAWDARTTSTDGLSFWTTDFATQDTDWNLVWSAGADQVHEPAAVYYKVGPATTAEYAVGWRLDGTGMEGGYFSSLLFSNVKQDTGAAIVADAQSQHSTTTPHSYTIAPNSSDAVWVTHGLNVYLTLDIPTFSPDTDMTELWEVNLPFSAGSDAAGMRGSLSWGNRDTDWTTLKQNFDSTAPEGTRTAVFQIYPIGIIAQGVAGLLQFTGTSWQTTYRDQDAAGTLVLSGAFVALQKRLMAGTLALQGAMSWVRKLSLAGVLSFAGAVTSKLLKFVIAIIRLVTSPIGVIRTWLTPSVDVELD